MSLLLAFVLQELQKQRAALAAKKASTAQSETTPGRNLKTMRVEKTPVKTPKKASLDERFV